MNLKDFVYDSIESYQPRLSLKKCKFSIFFTWSNKLTVKRKKIKIYSK